MTWPPDPSLLGTSSWRNLRRVRPGNPLYGTKMQLFSKTNYNLAVYADGAVRGTMDDNDLHSRYLLHKLQISKINLFESPPRTDICWTCWPCKDTGMSYEVICGDGYKRTIIWRGILLIQMLKNTFLLFIYTNISARYNGRRYSIYRRFSGLI